MTDKPEKRPPGRPRKNPEEGLRDQALHVDCTMATLTLLRLIQAEQGLASMGDTIAYLARKHDGS